MYASPSGGESRAWMFVTVTGALMSRIFTKRPSGRATMLTSGEQTGFQAVAGPTSVRRRRQ